MIKRCYFCGLQQGYCKEDPFNNLGSTGILEPAGTPEPVGVNKQFLINFIANAFPSPLLLTKYFSC